MKRIHLSIIIALTMTSCKEKKFEKTEENNLIVKENIITIPQNSPILKQIQLKKVEKKEYYNTITSVGTIESIPGNYAEIASPFSGRIIKSFVKLGQRVSAGSPLFEMLSSDYLSVQKEYSQALNESQLAEKKYKRQQDLVKHGVGVQKELEETETEFRNTKNSLSTISSALRVYNSKNKRTLVISSPINGTVMSSKIVNGQYLREDAEPVMIITELSKVWISGEVKEKDIRFIKIGDEVSIKVNTYPDQQIIGKVYHINDWVDESTKSIKVLIECDNPDRKLKPGMFSSITYSTDSEEAIIIPTKALMQNGNQQYIWIKTGKNQFKKQNVITKEFSDTEVKIISGLQSGDIMMTVGGIYLLDSLK